jgi:uncharacterized protein
VWVGALVAGSIAIEVAAEATDTPDGGDIPLTWLLGVVLVAQNLATIAGALVVSRWRGTGSPRDDLGFAVRPRDWWWLAAGAAAQAVLAALIWVVTQVVDADEDAQELVERMEDERSAGVVVLAVLAIVVLAPIAEELLYRGLLLRALSRWIGDVPAVVASAAVFAAVHLTGIDWGVSAVLVVLALFALALLLGTLAVRTGSLSRSILVHAGFNAVTTALALSGAG